MKTSRHGCKVWALALLFSVPTAYAQNVKITPLGSHPGELCDRDRATVLEDPTGVRILYDAGQSVTGADDARLGTVHVALLSHAHGDHIGDRKMSAVGAGTCEKPDTVSAAPNSTTAEIVAAKNAAIVMGSDMGVFVGKKVESIRGKPIESCAQTGSATVVPAAAPCLATIQLGGTRSIKVAGATRGVEITIVYASHSNNVPRALLSDPEKKNLEVDNLSLALGPPTGYVVKFSNDLRVYLSGDTGLHSEMKTIVHDFHKANLAIMNLGQNAGTPQAAAHAMNELVKPAAVIVSHPNEGVTSGGKLRPETRAAAFVGAIKGRQVYLALSGRTMEFDGKARCVSGCEREAPKTRRLAKTAAK